MEKNLILMSDNSITKELIKKELEKLMDHRLEDKKVLLVFTLRNERDKFFIEAVINNLIEIGIDKNNILKANISEEINPDNFQKIDFIYVCGGNTYYILDRLKKTGFDIFIKNFIEKGRVYVGVSAGVIILSQDISISGIGEDSDKNLIGLKDLSGLNILDFFIFPHYNNDKELFIKKFEEKLNKDIERLSDGEVLIIKGDQKNKIK